ncbi:alpha-glucosidase [Massilia sp. Root351]|uniref:glycoside hydrolase family 97 protein n=1 Tax=Massilia sp. Root351 TaxID=1736522 RepID=UPI00070A4BBF|nr:glycoside hydrolase family 97 protein [Massilia sp. Root351]KQV90286.1 alpha-glucosidase [Massilia sp. Root351]
MKTILLFLAALLLPLGATAQVNEQPGQASVASPDQNLRFVFYQKADAGGKRELYYRVTYKHKTIILDSLLDLQLDNHLSESAMALKVDRQAKWFDNLAITAIRHGAHDSSWKPETGERATIRDHYNQMTVNMVKDDNPIYPLSLEVRAYNEGVAFRFVFPENEKGTYYRVVQENTEFTFPVETKAWFHGWAQAPYRLLPLAGWPDESERPLTLEVLGRIHVALLEANMVDYSRTKFKLHKTKPNTIVTAMHDPADLISPFVTPWRGIMVAETAGALADNNHFILNLNPPSAIPKADWIKPGKIMRVMTQTTASAKANIDFAARRKLEYILFDWKWYGHAFSFGSDATKVAIPDFDLPEIIRYAAGKGIGVWLYVNQQALLAQGDSIFKTYRQWGVKGVKFGFVQVGSHRWTTWLEQAVRQAADAGLMVNIHDDWRPTGEQRTWPNLMTSEGIRGNEEMPDATHNTVLPFTRFLAGAADYTICYYDPRIKTTHAHQLALAAIYYSPLQTLYWYDKPEMSANEPELEFWDRIPTTWDDSKVLQGAPGQFVSTARRKGQDWFVGTITNNDARKASVKLDFLEAGRSYTATIYADDAAAPTKTKVGISKRRVNADSVIEAELPPSGGQAIWLTPER